MFMDKVLKSYSCYVQLHYLAWLSGKHHVFLEVVATSNQLAVANRKHTVPLNKLCILIHFRLETLYIVVLRGLTEELPVLTAKTELTCDFQNSDPSIANWTLVFDQLVANSCLGWGRWRTLGFGWRVFITLSAPFHITRSHLIHCYFKNTDYSCFKLIC